MPSSLPVLGVAFEFVGLPGTAKRRGLTAGDRLFSAGDPCDRLFVLDSGMIKLTADSGNGRECVLHVVQPGEIFGESVLLGEETYRYGAVVLETATVFVIPAASVARRVSEQPDLWLRAVPLLFSRLKRLEERLLWVTFLGVKQRVARLLLSLFHDNPKRRVISITQKDLAGMISATRETTSGALGSLQREGCIRTERRRITVISAVKLEMHAGEMPETGQMLELRAATI